MFCWNPAAGAIAYDLRRLCGSEGDPQLLHGSRALQVIADPEGRVKRAYRYSRLPLVKLSVGRADCDDGAGLYLFVQRL